MHARLFSRSLRARLALFAFIALLGSPAIADPAVWTGDAGDDNWSSAANWDSLPATDGTAAVTFSGAIRLTPNLDEDLAIQSLTFSSDADAFTLGGTGTLTLGSGGIDQSSTITQTIDLNLVLGADQTWNLASALAINGDLSGNGALTKTGSGTLVLSGAHTGTGNTTINAGTIRLAHDQALGSGTLTIDEGGTLDLDGHSQTFSEVRTLNFYNRTIAFGDGGDLTFGVSSGHSSFRAKLTGTGTLTKTGGGGLAFNNNLGSTFSGDIRVTRGFVEIAETSEVYANLNRVVIDITERDATSGFVVRQYYQPTVDVHIAETNTVGGITTIAEDATFNGDISGNGILVLQNDTSTTRTLTLGGNTKSFSGSTIHIKNATTKFGAANLFSSAVNVVLSTGQYVGGTSDVTVDLNGHDQAWTTLTRDSASIRNVTVTNTSGTGATLTLSGTATYTGLLAGNLGLRKSGAGTTLTLTGTHTYTGQTTIEGGTLIVNGSISTSSLTTVASGGTLGGSGTVGTLTVAAGGTLAPGNSSGTLTIVGDAIFEGGGSLIWDLSDATADPGIGWDLLSISGALAIETTSDNRFTIFITALEDSNPGDAANFDPTLDYSFTFLVADSIEDFDTNAFTLDTTAFANAFNGVWSIVSDGASLSINYTPSAIPEPSTYAAILGLGVLVLTALRRHRETRHQRRRTHQPHGS